MSYGEAVISFKREFLLQALVEAGGNQSQCAAMIGVHRNTMWRLLTEVGLNAADIRAAANCPPPQPGQRPYYAR